MDGDIFRSFAIYLHKVKKHNLLPMIIVFKMVESSQVY